MRLVEISLASRLASPDVRADRRSRPRRIASSAALGRPAAPLPLRQTPPLRGLGGIPPIARPDRFAKVGDGDDLEALHRGRLGTPVRGTIAVAKPSRAASRRRRSRPGNRSQLPRRPTSPMAIRSRGTCLSPARKPGPSPAADPAPGRSGPARPPDSRRRRDSPDRYRPGVPGRHEEGKSIAIDPRRGAPRASVATRRQRGPGPPPGGAGCLQSRPGDAAGACSIRCGEEGRPGSATSARPCSASLEAPTSSVERTCSSWPGAIA